MFGSSRPRATHRQAPRRGGFFSSSRTTRASATPTGRRRGLFHRRADPDRRAGGYKAALHNPNTTHDGRTHAKHELRSMGRANEARGHPSFKSRIKHFFGIRSRTSRHHTTRATHY